MKAINLRGEIYISAKRASKITGYTRDYIGQLCHAKKVDAELIGRSWYVSELGILKYKNEKTYLLEGSKSDIHKTAENVKKGELFTRAIEINDLSFKKREDLIRIIPEAFRFKPNYVGSKRIEYSKDDKPLFPVVERNINIDSIKYLINFNINQKPGKLIKKSNFERFVIVASLVSIFVLFSTIFISNSREIKGSISFGEKIKEGVSFMFGSYLRGIGENYKKFENNLASVSLSSGQNNITAWAKNTVYEVIKLWSQKDEPTLVNNPIQPYLIPENTCISKEQLQALLLSIQQESVETNTSTTSLIINDVVIPTNSTINAQ